ncbi:MAG: hypothetical protein KF770_02915 [Anaerolineae bacterium]|nr:hypothetical protein [Anaerolineae bacterium]
MSRLPRPPAPDRKPFMPPGEGEAVGGEVMVNRQRYTQPLRPYRALMVMPAGAVANQR